MKKINGWGAALALAMLPLAAAAQTNAKLAMAVPPENVARWGSPLTINALVTANCTGSAAVTLGPVTTPDVNAVPVATGNFAVGAFPCNAGTLSASAALQPNWLFLAADWQILQATATLTGTGTTQVAGIAPLRFDPEFQLPFGGNQLTATIATGAPGYASCTGHAFSMTDRETMGVPAPPPNVRTPFEVFHVATSTCNAAPLPVHLLNVNLPANFDEVWVYDRFSGTPAWRNPAQNCLKAPCPLAPASPTGGYTKIGRDAIIPVYGDSGGVQATVAFAVNQQDLRAFALQDTWWAGPSESGWGLTIAKNGDKLFVAGFIYDNAGNPTWVVMPDGQWDPFRLVWYGSLYTPTGSRFDSYNVGLFMMGSARGVGSLSFNNADVGHFDYTLDGAPGGKAIGRYVFAPRGDAPGKYTGIWWGGPDQAGWGLSVSQQSDTVFASWYTYDLNGKATWYFMPAGKQTGTGVFSGDLYRTTGATWVGTHYSADSTKVFRVGTMELRLDGTKPGMTATVDGKTVVTPLQRFDF